MNKTEKISKCREILHKHYSSEKISDNDDIIFLYSIFEGHNDWEQKMGCGVEYITTTNTKYGNKCFVIYRLDGTSTDISFMHCITNRSKIYEIKKACRSSIRQIIVDFRNKNVQFGTSKCPFTNEILYVENTHIDHYDMSFDELFKIWLNDYNQDYLHSKINQQVDNTMEMFFEDEEIIKKFIEFHNKNTHLRAISKKANLSKLSKNTI